MINFNLKEAAIFQAVKWSSHPAFRFARPLRKLFSVLFVLTFLIFLYGFFGEIFSSSSLSILLGLSIIFLTLSLFNWLEENFLNSKLKKPKLKARGLEEAIAEPEKYNLAEFLSFEAAKSLWEAIKFSQKKKFSQIPSEALLYFSLEEIPEINFIFFRALLNLKEIKKELKNYLNSLESSPPPLAQKLELSADSQKVILEAAKIAQRRGRQIIERGDILVSQSSLDPTLKRHLIETDLKIEDIENLTSWLESLKEKNEERKKFWEYQNLAKKGSLAKEWMAGYTITLDQYSIDWTEILKKKGFEEIIGHQEEISQVERILARLEINNVLLVGEPGVGRGSIVQALAQKSLFGQSLPQLNYKRVVELDIASLLSRIESSEEVELILDQIFQEVILAGNIILVIDEFHNYVGQISRPGVIDISGVISPYLKLPQFRIISITNFSGLHKYLEQNPSLLALFEKVEVREIFREETLRILGNLALVLEQKYKKFVSYLAIREIVNYTDRYLPGLPFPKKALDLLDEVMIYVTGSTKDSLVLPEHVAKIFSEKTQIPVGEIEIKEREILLNLENLIHQRIINQEEAVKEVSTALRRARTDIAVGKRPMGTFLFLGPTGVGKTETSKALAEIYFGSEEKMIRLDMSEFQTVLDIPRLIGSPIETGLLTTLIRENPFSLILLDEIEKAHPNILNLFLQVLDEGYLTDGLGRKVSFSNSIIIATSNAGYKIILDALKKKLEMSQIKDKLLDYLFSEGIFRPEFINRFDAVVVFRSLTKENLLKIVELMFKKLRKNLETKNIEFIITEPLKEKIVEIGYSPVFGAREIRRVIQDKVENVLASALLKGELRKGDRIEIEAENFQIQKK